MKWLRFVTLSWKDKILFLRVAYLVLATRIALKMLPYKRVLKYFEDMGVRKISTNESPEERQRYAKQVIFLTKAAGRRLLGKKPCLPQALVVECLFKRHGFDASLHIGVIKGDDGGLLAHAWVESGGNIVIGGQISQYRYARMRPMNAGES